MKMLLSIFGLLLFFSACGPDPIQKYNRESEQKRLSSLNQNAPNQNTPCQCTYESNPVCGVDGKVYDNPCIANCYKVGYSMGVCETSDCSQSGTVCGEMPGDNSQRNYSDDCKRKEAGAKFIKTGACS